MVNLRMRRSTLLIGFMALWGCDENASDKGETSKDRTTAVAKGDSSTTDEDASKGNSGGVDDGVAEACNDDFNACLGACGEDAECVGSCYVAVDECLGLGTPDACALEFSVCSQFSDESGEDDPCYVEYKECLVEQDPVCYPAYFECSSECGAHLCENCLDDLDACVNGSI